MIHRIFRCIISVSAVCAYSACDPQSGAVEEMETSDRSEMTTTPEIEDQNTGISFIDMTDTPTPRECNILDQDCPPGEKCMPYANDGGASWNATRCSPQDPTPAAIGDPCSVDGDGVSGLDNCESGSMCWDVDGETNQGTCTAFCVGTESSADCSDPNTECSITNDGVLILCLPTCNPVMQDCGPGQACYAIDDAFVCAPDASGPELGQFGDPCEFINACDPGLGCFDASLVPACTTSDGCCSNYCDITEAETSATCPGASGGQSCVAVFAEGQSPPGYENVGVCLLPST